MHFRKHILFIRMPQVRPALFIVLFLFLRCSLTLAQQVPFDAKNFWKWSYHVKTHKLYYWNGKQKSVGLYRVYTSKKDVWVIPVFRHLHYWQNGNLKKVAHYSQYGVLICDSTFKRNGTLKKVSVYKERTNPAQDSLR